MSKFDPPSEWAKTAWDWAMSEGIMSVDSDPHKTMTKQEYAVFLHRQAGNPVPEPQPVPMWVGRTLDDWRNAGSIALSGGGRAEDIAGGVRLFNENVDGISNVGARLGFQNRGGVWSGIDNLPDGLYEADIRVGAPYFSGESNVMQFKTRSREHGQRIMLWKAALSWNSVEGQWQIQLATRIQTNGEWMNTVRYVTDPILIGQGPEFALGFGVRWSAGDDGSLDLYVDGVLAHTHWGPTLPTNVTEYDRPREWVVSHYLSNWQGALPDSHIDVLEARVWV